MRTRSRLSSRTRGRTPKKTLAEILRGPTWVAQQWEAAKGLLKGRTPKNPVAWQRKIRREWETNR